MNEIELIKNKELRENYIERIDVLEKVKRLLLLPDISLATREQVSQFYNVGESAIRMIENRHQDEIDSDGFKIWKASDFKTYKMCELKIYKNRGSFEVEFLNGDKEKFSPRGVALYTRRAILRVGMLLRDSEIAKEVRTQLLNIEEKTSNDVKIQAINKEQELVLKIVYSKDQIEIANATRELLDYKNRHIQKLETEIDLLATGNLTWNTRESVNRMARKIACRIFGNKHAKSWDKIYAEMLYKHNINVTSRINNYKEKYKTKATIFEVLDNNELKLLVKSCLSLCEMYKIKTDDLLIKNV